MEFYVVDPKDTDYSHWTERVREFLTTEAMKFSEASGELYYLGDDVASPWDEASVAGVYGAAPGGGRPRRAAAQPGASLPRPSGEEPAPR